ncbi:hypothetical protein OSB04_007132 [Centaurea solstitialis]|uniref:Uncharacterized protein n=1 Tax=Centaurea solstitialis TaxID=347529 RepID=A0AA38U2J9_9ASTR|nr:hypothetical protein OSB04_007132 [Centaurea solstitialis]
MELSRLSESASRDESLKKGQTVMGDIAVSSQSLSNGDLPNLWHVRDRCMSFGSMTELSQHEWHYKASYHCSHSPTLGYSRKDEPHYS